MKVVPIRLKRQLLLGVAVAALATGFSAYHIGASVASQEKNQEKAGAAQSPAIPVVVQTLNEQPVRVWSEFSGRLHAVDAAEIKPEVSGRITEIRFDDGQEVNAGDVLMVIDPRPYEAAVAKAEAKLATAQANSQFAKTDLSRAAAMVKSEAIAKRLYDERANSSKVATASIKEAEAELKQAQIDLDHAYVKAPISGRVGRAEITVGNLVQAGAGAPLLTSIVSNRGIYADFEVDEQTYLKTIRNAANGREQEARVPVQLTVKGDKDHVYEGTVSSFDNRIDPASGTIRARAKFDNADGALVPGMFVSVNLAGGSDSTALLVPERAIGFDQNKKFVYVVGSDNKVAYREVEVGKQVQAQRIVLKGVQAGERVIVDGLQHVRPDALVAPKEASETDAAKSSSAVNDGNRG